MSFQYGLEPVRSHTVKNRISGPMKSDTVKENHSGSAVRENFLYRQTYIDVTFILELKSLTLRCLTVFHNS